MQQPIDRDTQIELMRDSEERLRARVQEFLRVPAIRANAFQCAYDAGEPAFTTKQVKVSRRA